MRRCVVVLPFVDVVVSALITDVDRNIDDIKPSNQTKMNRPVKRKIHLLIKYVSICYDDYIYNVHATYPNIACGTALATLFTPCISVVAPGSADNAPNA